MPSGSPVDLDTAFSVDRAGVVHLENCDCVYNITGWSEHEPTQNSMAKSIVSYTKGMVVTEQVFWYLEHLEYYFSRGGF